MILGVCALALPVAVAITALAGVALAGRMIGGLGQERRRLTHRETVAADLAALAGTECALAVVLEDLLKRPVHVVFRAPDDPEASPDAPGNAGAFRSR